MSITRFEKCSQSPWVLCSGFCCASALPPPATIPRLLPQPAHHRHTPQLANTQDKPKQRDGLADTLNITLPPRPFPSPLQDSGWEPPAHADLQPSVHLPHLQAPCPPGRSRHGQQTSASADTYSCSRATPALSRLPSGIFQPVLEENPLLAVPHSLWEGRGAWRRPPILLHEKKVTH